MVDITPFVKQIRSEACFFDRLQKLLRDDRVGVDILAVHGRHETFV